MCEPITISTTALWVMGATAAVGVATAAYSADQQRKEGRANAEIMENNALLAEQGAKNASAMGDREAEQAAWRNRAVLGQQRAAIAANGIDSQTGTANELLGETAMFGEIDQQTIRLNTAQSAWGFRAEANNNRNQGAQAKWQGKSKATGTMLSGLGSAMGTMSGAWG